MGTQELRIAPDGRLYAMHSDELLPLLESVGDARVERASFVEFDNDRHAWAVADVNGRDTLLRFPTRAAALDWERRHFWALLGLEGAR